MEFYLQYYSTNVNKIKEGENIKLKNLVNNFLKIVYILLILPLIIIAIFILLITVIVTFPVEYPKYKRSKYYQKYKEKYEIGITSTDKFKIINYFEKNNIKYEAFNSKEESFKINNITYLFPWFEILTFDQENNCIIAEQDNDDFELLKDVPKIKDKKNIKILINENEIQKKDITKARNEKILLLYKEISDINKNKV